jgi:hypothetical protein
MSHEPFQFGSAPERQGMMFTRRHPDQKPEAAKRLSSRLFSLYKI